MLTDSTPSPSASGPGLEVELTTRRQESAQSGRPGRAAITGRVEMHATLARKAASAQRPDQQSLNILLMGDFSGRASLEVAPAEPALADRRIVGIDIDNIDQVMATLAPRVRLALVEAPDSEAILRIKDLDELHPDELYRTLDIFEALRRTREQLMDPATFAETAARLQQLAGRQPESSQSGIDEAAPGEGGVSAFEQLLGGKTAATGPAGQSTPQAASSSIDRLLRQVVEPHIVPAADPQRDQLVASIDDAISAHMRKVLHGSDFQAVEAAWRSVFDIVRNVETSEELKLFMLDVTLSELQADLAHAGDDLTSSGLYRLLVDRTIGMPGAEPWGLLIGDYTFGSDVADIDLLSAMGTIASHAGAPFLAAGGASLLGISSFANAPDPADWTGPDASITEHWLHLRRSPQARWLGLAMPRLMLRLPYGRDTDPVDAFDFEEITSPDVHESYLWGNPAFPCARLIAEAFTQRGWALQPGDCVQIDDVPAHIRIADGESKMKAPAEAFLSERAMETVLVAGLMPVLSFLNQNIVRVARFQSLADPPQPLAGPWHG